MLHIYHNPFKEAVAQEHKNLLPLLPPEIIAATMLQIPEALIIST